ncbi:MAG TPA: phosphoribosylaminoimidazolesuccinocarboxamide synthase [Solirubrobacteraceae bacterium]|nr:phosphoribosylaminoimidazolesuccinocarboxamide synthase [Solirubrobacteraceae bacterium]
MATIDLPLLHSGKVRDMYAMGDSILMVASDRISTYDVVHPTPIPDKGKVLTGISVAWFELTEQIVANHMLAAAVPVPTALRGRALVVRALKMLPVECVVRGYLTGSGWKDYQATGAVCGIELPAGLRESERLPEPIFTPASKAELGEHDENISFEAAVAALGDLGTAERLRDISLELYDFAAAHALERGIILADTKFEFGFDASGVLTLGDEALTPDSSRFWPADGYEAGRPQPSFDKQFVRDWASSTGWDRTAPAPAIPAEIVTQTRALYIEAYERIVGRPFAAWLDRVGAPAQDAGLAGDPSDPRAS